MKTRGFDDLAEFTVDAERDGRFAAQEAVRRVAQATGRELRRLARQNFGAEWRVWDAGSLSKSIRVKRIAPGHYRVDSKAIYVKGRSDEVNLLWVFDQAPVVRSGRKKGVSIPIKGRAPIARNGRRYAWPSELEAMGWDLSFAPIRGKNSVLILGRRNSREDPVPLYIWKPSVKMPKRFDLDALHTKHAATLDEVWGRTVDSRQMRRAARNVRKAA